ncbi:MAG TPA: hypothetical protein VJL61_08705 [Rhodanobacteraceae bacterium]|nr:hypothetical protein [Rhodanobacteraceae bacterium]
MGGVTAGEGHKDVLMVGFHFPPSTLSSGHLRLLAFAKYLPSFGWNPVVLTARGNIYEHSDPASISTIPPDVRMHRAFALDARRHMGIGGKYPSWLARPDRWVSWWPAAVLSGLYLIKRHRIQAIWSTYPIMTAHCVAHTLSRISGLPWIADFRDPVASSVSGKDRATVASQMRWEQRVMSRATCTVFTTPGAVRVGSSLYSSALGEGRIQCIPNGFDEDDFAGIEIGRPSSEGGPLHFVHGGVLYPEGRNPARFFEALAELKRTGALKASDIRVTLRASGSEDVYAEQLRQLGLTDIVTLAPYLPYKDALAEQAEADGLLLFQGERYDHQIPAKVYEYLRLGRPILGLVGENGDTAALLRKARGAVTAPLNSASAIAAKVLEFIDLVKQSRNGMTSSADVQRYSRRHATQLLAGLLDRVCVYEK